MLKFNSIRLIGSNTYRLRLADGTIKEMSKNGAEWAANMCEVYDLKAPSPAVVKVFYERTKIHQMSPDEFKHYTRKDYSAYHAAKLAIKRAWRTRKAAQCL